MSGVPHSNQVKRALVVVAAVTMALYVGFKVTESPRFAIIAVGAFFYVLTVPKHFVWAAFIILITFKSALIVPGFPGRPFVWELCAMVAWPSLLLVLMTRRLPGRAITFQRDELIALAALLGYTMVLVVIMAYRGVGLRVLGSDQMGGRFYLQQMLLIITPFLFLVVDLKREHLIRLFFLQCAFSLTFLVSDFALTFGSGVSAVALMFFEVPSDAINFTVRYLRGGFLRFQSFSHIGLGFTLALLVLFSVRDIFGKKCLLALPALAVFVFIAMLSGHRASIYFIVMVPFFVALIQRFFNPARIIMLAVLAAGGLLLIYRFAPQLPLSAQRAVSFLPGITIQAEASIDASNTLLTRKALIKLGWEAAPEYFWVGRGFSVARDIELIHRMDPTGVTKHFANGRFYNGFIGGLVNTGFFGTLALLAFVLAISHAAWQAAGLTRRRRVGEQTVFDRLTQVACAFWFATVPFYYLLHGNAEKSLHTFGVWAGLILICRKRLLEELEIEKAAALAGRPAEDGGAVAGEGALGQPVAVPV